MRVATVGSVDASLRRPMLRRTLLGGLEVRLGVVDLVLRLIELPAEMFPMFFSSGGNCWRNDSARQFQPSESARDTLDSLFSL